MKKWLSYIILLLTTQFFNAMLSGYSVAKHAITSDLEFSETFYGKECIYNRNYLNVSNGRKVYLKYLSLPTTFRQSKQNLFHLCWNSNC